MKPTTFETLIQDQKERIFLKKDIEDKKHNEVLNFIDEINDKK
jgi:hypothetical protein